MRKAYFILSMVVLSVATHLVTSSLLTHRMVRAGTSPPCGMVQINTLTCSYNPNTDNCTYTIDLSCPGDLGDGCSECYVVHLWRLDVNSNWNLVSATCYDAPVDCGGSEHISSGLAPLFGPGPYWFQVDIWEGSCSYIGSRLDTVYTEFTRP